MRPVSTAGTRQKAHVPVQARVATSCRHTVPSIDTGRILRQSNHFSNRAATHRFPQLSNWRQGSKLDSLNREGTSNQLGDASGFQADSVTRQIFEGMLAARRESLTRWLDQSESPEGRGLKHTFAALHHSPRTTSLGLRDAPCVCML